MSHTGAHYRLENARIYTLPESPPRVLVAAGGQQSAKLAGRIGDGLIGTAPDGEILREFEDAGGAGKPRYAQMTVCWAASEDEARRTAHKHWPTAGLKGELTQELRLPAHFEQAAANVSEDQVAGRIVCGPDPGKHLEGIRRYMEAGYDHVYIHQVGPDQEGFFRFYEREVLSVIGSPGEAAAVARG